MKCVTIKLCQIFFNSQIGPQTFSYMHFCKSGTHLYLYNRYVTIAKQAIAAIKRK